MCRHTVFFYVFARTAVVVIACSVVHLFAGIDEPQLMLTAGPGMIPATGMMPPGAGMMPAQGMAPMGGMQPNMMPGGGYGQPAGFM